MDKELERNIVSIVDTIHNAEDTYVIVTSREDVFNKFTNKANADEKEIKKFEIRLNLGTRSYTSEKRKEILLKHAQVWNCNWLNNENLKNMILASLTEQANLPTPLNIKDFVNATKKVTDKEEIIEKIKTKSQQTVRSFADDIYEMKQHDKIDKILFLCFPFISDWFSYDFVKTEYNDLLKDFNIKDDYAFQRVCLELQDKVEISDYVRFSHPAYSEALPFILSDKNGIPTKINTEIFGKILTILSDKEKAYDSVAHIISNNFDKLPEKVQNLLFKLASNKESANSVARSVDNNFDKLPYDMRNKLLLKIYECQAHMAVFTVIINNYEALPQNIKNLIFELLPKQHQWKRVEWVYECNIYDSTIAWKAGRHSLFF